MTALNTRASLQGRVFTATEARRMAWRSASAFPSSGCLSTFSASPSPQLVTSLSSVHPLSFSLAPSSSCVSSHSLLSPAVCARRFSSRCRLFPLPLSASSLSSSCPSAVSVCSSSLSCSSASARFASSASSPLRQTATAAAAGRAAAAAAKRREERKLRERWMRLQKGLKVGGTVGAIFVVTAGSLAWFLSSLKRRHPPPPVDPDMSLPFPLADELCISPVPLSSLPTSSVSSSPCSACCSRDSSLSCASTCASNCALACSSRSCSCGSEGSGSRSLPNVYPSPEALTELSEKYPFFPASKELFLKAASHVLPLEYHLHLRNAFCRYLALRLSEDVCKCRSPPSHQSPHGEKKEQEGSACQRGERVLTADKVKATMREIWEFLGVSTEREGDDGAHTFFSLIDFDSEIEAFLTRLQMPPSASPSSSCPSPSPFSSSVEEFAERVKEKISDVLLTNWQRQRFFDPLTFKRSSFTRRISHEAAGRDVGTPAPSFSYADVDLSRYGRCASPSPASSPSVPPSSSSSLLSSVVSFFLRPFSTGPSSPPAVSKADSPSSSSPSPSSSLSSEPLFLGTHQIQKAVASLKEYGVCIIRGGLTRQQLDVLQRTLHTDEAMAMSSAMAMQAEDPNVWCTRPTTGRLHCLLRGTLLEAPLADAQRVWMPVVFSYLPCDARGGFSSEPDARLTSAWKGAKSAVPAAGETATRGERGVTDISAADDELDDGRADPKKGLLAVSELSKRLFVSDMQTVDAGELPLLYRISAVFRVPSLLLSASHHRDARARSSSPCLVSIEFACK
ncbi:Phytanoyl-CoA dioxygenase (PhyH) superfamily protein [Toxoplasma gondii FOU]|uniref:Phytanoyl-CoA dioxygenase (PhyH) superfamily protein n=1 Tax=Toxoplasma gondii FOU TaxID=943167 RepID=A0A086LHS1_TOXGO|nr:Phytanoyl-CoA dioxygenase (PhyH) superfamily protein [Toxoplasma gondii FOU]